MKKQIKNTNKIQILWLLKRTISNLKKENIIQSAHSIIKILDDHYPFSFNLIVSQMMYLSILRRECDCDLCFTFLKEIELLEETILSINQKILNVFSHFLLKNSSQESKYLLENMIEHNLIESTIIKNKKIPYFVHYMTEKEFFKLYYIDKKSHENQNPFIKKIKENYEELSKNNFELHKKLIKEGHNPNEIAKIIRNDEIEKLQEISSQSNFDFNQTIEPSLYESCDFINNKTVSLIDYAAFFVSVKCFKYLLMNNADVRNTGKYAVAGGNEEIIHLCEQHRSTFVDAYETAIKFQQNDIFKYIYENKIGKIDSLEKLGKKCVLYHNYYIFSFLLKQGMKIDDGIINESARIGNIFLSEYFSEICKMPSDILCFSAASGNIEHVKYLLGKGIYINSEDAFNNLFGIFCYNFLFHNNVWKLFIIFKSALLHATQNGNIEVVKLLLELKCKVNTQMRVHYLYLSFV